MAYIQIVDEQVDRPEDRCFTRDRIFEPTLRHRRAHRVHDNISGFFTKHRRVLPNCGLRLLNDTFVVMSLQRYTKVLHLRYPTQYMSQRRSGCSTVT
jgi:hypothetical protein